MMGTPVVGPAVQVKVIFNPYADRWKAGSRVAALHAALREAGLEYELTETAVPGEATRAASDAAIAKFEAVVAAGGDGTVNEVVNGLVLAAGDEPTKPLGVLPLGTANDFAEMAGLPRGLEQAAAVVAGGRTRQIDAGRVTYWLDPGASGPIERYFANNCAVGVEPLVTIESARMQWLPGNLRYVVGLLRAIRQLKAWQMRITWDDGGHEGATYLLSVCNTPRCGGVFRMAPGARLDDGLFDFVFAPELSKLEVLGLLPRFFRGTHLRHPKVVCGRAKRITIDATPPTPVHADGEVLTESATRVEYELLPGRLTLLTPKQP